MLPIPERELAYAPVAMLTDQNSTAKMQMSKRYIARIVSAFGSAGLLGGLAACADAPSAPTALQPSGPSVVTTGTTLNVPETVQGLMRTSPLAQTVVVTKTLSNGGGGISVPGTDFQLQVPNGAFAEKSMTFTITAYAGNVVAYDFQPHGYKFLKPLKAVQQLGHTSWKSLKLPAGMYSVSAGAYFQDPSLVDFTTGLATVNEFMTSTFSIGGATMTWDVPHFSGYIVAWGRH